VWRPDRALIGPRRATPADVEALNTVFSETFTDRYRRDGLAGVRVPPLNPLVWHYAMRDAGDGAMLWLDEHDDIVAFNVAHRSGSEGWMGPLAVRLDRQGLGVGGIIVRAALDWLEQRNVSTIGLETMPRTLDNIGFYSRLGFDPAPLTVTMTGEASHHRVAGDWIALSRLDDSERADLMQRCTERIDRSLPGRDYRREMDLTQELRLGDTLVFERGGVVLGFVVWHGIALAANRPADEVRVLKLFADSNVSFERVLVALEATAAARRLPRVAIRCQSGYAEAYRSLIARGYRVRWTDLRMTRVGFPEQCPPAGEIVFSNWEI
jgi:GNAT superfamily N-acetyltransferase